GRGGGSRWIPGLRLEAAELLAQRVRAAVRHEPLAAGDGGFVAQPERQRGLGPLDHHLTRAAGQRAIRPVLEYETCEHVDSLGLDRRMLTTGYREDEPHLCHRSRGIEQDEALPLLLEWLRCAPV